MLELVCGGGLPCGFAGFFAEMLGFPLIGTVILDFDAFLGTLFTIAFFRPTCFDVVIGLRRVPGEPLLARLK